MAIWTTLTPTPPRSWPSIPKDIHTLQDVGNHPATRYIMTSMIGQWQDRIAPADHPHTAAYPVAE